MICCQAEHLSGGHVPSSTVEQYIKTVYLQIEQNHRPLVQMKELSDAMAVTPGTATSMVKHLDEQGLLEYLPRKGVQLTEKGRQLALKMVRRHRLIETFLEKVLGYDWAEVHDDAERLEHAVSDKFIIRIAEVLENPDFDPHGDPIPSAEGAVELSQDIPVIHCPENAEIEIRRIADTDPEFLALMKSLRLTPGERFSLLEISQVAGTLRLRHSSGEEAVIGYEAGARIMAAASAARV